MNERINALADLFGQRAEIDRQILVPLSEAEEEPEQEPEEEEERARPKTRKERRVGRYTKHNPMPEEVKEEIRSKIAARETGADLANEYGVSSASIYKVAKIHARPGHDEKQRSPLLRLHRRPRIQ